MSKRNGPWSKMEMLRVLAVYATLDEAEKRTPPKKVIEDLQKVLPLRSAASITMRISNFVARDPGMQILGMKGLTSGGDHVDMYWNENSDSDRNLKVDLILYQLATTNEN